MQCPVKLMNQIGTCTGKHLRTSTYCDKLISYNNETGSGSSLLSAVLVCPGLDACGANWTVWTLIMIADAHKLKHKATMSQMWRRYRYIICIARHIPISHYSALSGAKTCQPGECPHPVGHMYMMLTL